MIMISNGSGPGGKEKESIITHPTVPPMAGLQSSGCALVTGVTSVQSDLVEWI